MMQRCRGFHQGLTLQRILKAPVLFHSQGHSEQNRRSLSRCYLCQRPYF